MGNCIRILLFTLAMIHAHAQISGIITDARSKKPLTDVEIFIQGKTVSALSNPDGEFALEAIQPGFNNLVLYKKGYQLFKSSIRIEGGKAYALNLSIESLKKEKGLKLPVGDHAPEILKFKEALFRKDHLADFKLLNEAALTFVNKPDGLHLKADEPILIDNNTLGYQLRYYLLNCTFAGNDIQVHGYFTFLPTQAQGSEQIVQWFANRLKIYQGSLRHLLKSLLEGKTNADGFDLLDKNGAVLNPSILIAPSIPNYHKVLLEDAITVRYKGISSQLIPKGSLQINNEGILLIPQNLEVAGSMASQSTPTLLPNDYLPVIPETEDYMRFYEKAYVHTDKPYYYPGEPLWFKGYVNYYNPTWRDSLSQVVYVEIIHPKKSIVLSKTLRIDSGFFHGDFILPDTLSSGGYFLRAYTQLSRNYGDENLFIKSIPVLNMTDKADAAQVITETNADNGLTVTTDKPKYKSREKITLVIQLKDKDGKPVKSNLSVSVTDAVQVVPVSEPINILNGYPIDRTQKIKNIEFKYPAEFGVGYAGRFLNDKGKPEKTSLTILQLKPRSVLFAETNQDGYFTQTGLHFYDTASYSFKSDKAKDFPYGKVILVLRESPPSNIGAATNTITILKTGTAQRFISEYEVPKDSKLLKTIEVKASRLPRDETEEPDYRIKRSYGKADYVLSRKDLKLDQIAYGNLVMYLYGKVPGLEPGMTFRRASAQSIGFAGSPLVTINDVQMAGSSMDVLSMIDPSTVESVEFTPSVNVLYGSQGAFGVIAVYTKQGVKGVQDKVQNFQTLILHGYAWSRAFTSPDYENPTTDRTKPDYRATIFWDPQVATSSNGGTAVVSFFSSDLPGRYRIVVEGINLNGEAVRGVYYVEVESD